METQRIEVWADLSHLVEAYHRERWIFRGVPDQEFQLIPTVGRKMARRDPSSGIHRPYSSTEGKRLLNQFIREARSHLPYEPRSILEWLAIAQHHGMPTRLLDWTESPLIAAYFAVRAVELGQSPSEAAVYGTPILPLATDTDEEFPFEVDDAMPKLYRPPHLSSRIVAQRGVFTLHPNPERSYEPDEMIKWVIPRDRCFDFRVMLDTCGINQASLFPDLEGLGLHLGWCYKYGRLA